MTHVIYFTLSVENHIQILALLLITKLREEQMILVYPLIKKHRVLFNIVYDFITYFSRFYIHLETFLFFVPSKPIEKTKKTFKAK